MASTSKVLVIDASVAMGSGGEKATHPDSISCRDFLSSVLKICHKVGMTPELREEWDDHQSNFARTWRSSMVARRKLVPLRPSSRPEFIEALENLPVSQEKKDATIKDCHLVEAALIADLSVVALDEVARELFSMASVSFPDLKKVIWVNPVTSREKSMEWLQDGAPSVGHKYVEWRLAAGTE